MFCLQAASEDDTICLVEVVSLPRYEPSWCANTGAVFYRLFYLLVKFCLYEATECGNIINELCSASSVFEAASPGTP